MVFQQLTGQCAAFKGQSFEACWGSFSLTGEIEFIFQLMRGVQLLSRCILLLHFVDLWPRRCGSRFDRRVLMFVGEWRSFKVLFWHGDLDDFLLQTVWRWKVLSRLKGHFSGLKSVCTWRIWTWLLASINCSLICELDLFECDWRESASGKLLILTLSARRQYYLD